MRAIVTGAASGIGRATALRLARDSHKRDGEPAKLLLVDIASAPLAKVADEVRAEQAEGHVFVGDLADVSVPARIGAEAAARLGGLDALISNAGIVSVSLLDELKVEEYDRTFAINTRATWLLAQAVLPLLKTNRGCIVATSSIGAEGPSPPLGAYSASKAALVMLIKQLALEWGRYGIRCNCIAPGSTLTGMTQNVYSDPAKRAERAASIPLGRVATPEEMAAVISFLVGPDSAYVTGISLSVDGGVLVTSRTPSGWSQPKGPEGRPT